MWKINFEFYFCETNMCFANECVWKNFSTLYLVFCCFLYSVGCVLGRRIVEETKKRTYYVWEKGEYLICLQAHGNMIQANISGKLSMDSCLLCFFFVAVVFTAQHRPTAQCTSKEKKQPKIRRCAFVLLHQENTASTHTNFFTFFFARALMTIIKNVFKWWMIRAR